MSSFTSSLNQPLPADAIAGMTWGPFRYRRYPVFSLPWLTRRLWVSAIAVILYGALSSLAQLGAGESPASAWLAGGYFVMGSLLMFTVGPALATWVRYRHWSRKVEAWGVIVAVVLGLVASMLADSWASNHIRHSLKVKEVPPSERKISELDEAALRLAKLGGGLLYFACCGGLASLAYFSERRRLRARAAHLAELESNMKLAVLQAQIEPHFLFNTLASIRPLVRQDPLQAEAAIDAFADHLRATIPQMRDSSSSVTSTLGQQVDICASYLKVMQVRMGARLHSQILVSEELRHLSFPPLMLLSLVENAIKHGIEPKPGPGCIAIRAVVSGASLQVSVADDGLGLKDGLSTGLGLANIREQLQVRFAGKAKLHIAARPDGGTVADITIPLA